MDQTTGLTTEDIMQMDKQYVMNTYGRLPVVLLKGEGCYVYDSEGRKYLDMVAGIAVNNLGHCHPRVASAIKEQVSTLMHTSNLYFTSPQPKLAKLLCENSDMDKAFFCNSGAEANEAALKIARKAGKQSAGDEKMEVICAERSFHGRTLAAITATGQLKYQKSFVPLIPGFKHVVYNDVSALTEAVNEKTCAIMMEPVQGESGVHPATNEFLQAARELCDKTGAALIFDEVQTGLGRTGKLFGYQLSGVIPDILTLAKTLGGGFPIGSCLARGKWADVFEPGDHASTFGGNPLACSAAIAAASEIIEGGLVENSHKMGDYLMSRLSRLDATSEVRGHGLMVAVDLVKENAKEVATEAMQNGLLVNAIGDTTIRFVPPLIITKEQIDEGLQILEPALRI